MASFQAPAASVQPSRAPSKREAVKAVSGAYIVISPFTVSLGGTTVRYETGDVLDKPYIIAPLLQSKSPILPAEKVGEILQCPHCLKKFVPKHDE